VDVRFHAKVVLPPVREGTCSLLQQAREESGSSGSLLQCGRTRFRGTVASLTSLRCRLVEENGFGIDTARQLVALAAAYILVGSAQGELGTLVVIKQRRLPLHAVVTVSASCDTCVCELLPVNILVAVFALRRRSREIDVDQSGFQVWWLVAIHAGRRAVRSGQRECGFGMIEAR